VGRDVFLGGQRKRAWPQRSQICGFLLFMRTVRIHPMTQNCQRGNTYMGRELVLGDIHAPPQRGRGPSAPNFLGSLFMRTTPFDVVTHMGMGLIFRGSATAPSLRGGAEPQRSPIFTARRYA